MILLKALLSSNKITLRDICWFNGWCRVWRENVGHFRKRRKWWKCHWSFANSDAVDHQWSVSVTDEDDQQSNFGERRHQEWASSTWHFHSFFRLWLESKVDLEQFYFVQKVWHFVVAHKKGNKRRKNASNSRSRPTSGINTLQNITVQYKKDHREREKRWSRVKMKKKKFKAKTWFNLQILDLVSFCLEKRLIKIYIDMIMIRFLVWVLQLSHFIGHLSAVAAQRAHMYAAWQHLSKT